MARSNNKEWFYLPKKMVWEIFIEELNLIALKYNLMIHAFVLMDNHYHMLVTTHSSFNLGVVMCELQTSVSRKVNRISGRINHVFGGNYKASLITTPEYYYSVYRYIYRNPIEVNASLSADDYLYSSCSQPEALPLSSPISGIAAYIPQENKLAWLNEDQNPCDVRSIQRGLRKTEFKFIFDRKY